MQGSFDLHTFCSPSTSSIQHLPATTDDPHAWVSLTRFIGQLPGLQDLVWACSISLPPPILNAVRNRGCRLHLHQFLDTCLAMNPYNSVQTSFPYLSSMVLHQFPNMAPWHLDHPAHDIVRAALNLAPALKHVSPIRSMGDGLGDTPFQYREGSINSATFSETWQRAELNQLRSLCLTRVAWKNTYSLYHTVDFTMLRSLKIRLNDFNEWSRLDDKARSGDFRSLHSLEVHYRPFGPSPRFQESIKVLTGFLKSLNPLRRLSIEIEFVGVGNEMPQIILQRHGRSLVYLRVFEWQFPFIGEKSPPKGCFTESMVDQMADICHNLEQIPIPIDRTRSGHHEMGICRALGRFPRLRTVYLQLRPDQVGKRIPMAASVQNPFSYPTLSKSLVRSIFDIISPPNSGSVLSHLRIQQYPEKCDFRRRG